MLVLPGCITLMPRWCVCLVKLLGQTNESSLPGNQPEGREEKTDESELPEFLIK